VLSRRSIFLHHYRWIIVFLFWQNCYSAEIFYWKDDAGRRHYSDRPAINATKKQIDSGFFYSRVKTVFDGDTFVLQNGNRIRLLGINTPEVEGRRKSAEPGGEKAKQWLKEKILVHKVRLQADIEKFDHYKRRLAHVFTESGEHINLRLVELGLASVNIYPPNLLYAEQFVSAQQQAQQARLGIWGHPAYATKPIRILEDQRLRGWQRLVGRPIKIRHSKKFARLIFSTQVDVRISLRNLALFPSLNNYLGKDIEVRGWPSRRKKHYSILVRHPSALVEL